MTGRTFATVYSYRCLSCGETWKQKSVTTKSRCPECEGAWCAIIDIQTEVEDK